MKFNYPTAHPAQKVKVASLFHKVIKQKIPEASWDTWISQQLDKLASAQRRHPHKP
jgi:hypothetical protein